jgi:hypothetical protein
MTTRTKFSPSPSSLTQVWYAKLAMAGFYDIESNPEDPTGPLIDWTGVSLEGRAPDYSGEPGHGPKIDGMDSLSRQAALQDVQSSFTTQSPSPRLQDLLHHEGLDLVSRVISKRPRCDLSPRQVKKILELKVSGETERGIAARMRITSSTVHRCVEALRGWSNVIVTNEDDDGRKPKVTVVCRPFNAKEDLPFVYATWRNCVWYTKHPDGDGVRGAHDLEAFVARANTIISDFLKRAQVKVACSKEEPSHVIGYSVSTGDHLEFIYVKANYRSAGVGKMLLPRPCKSVAKPFTNVGEAIVRNGKGRYKVKA